MSSKTTLLHAAVTCDTLEHADLFFTTILGLKLQKTFIVDTELSTHIFDISAGCDVRVYANANMTIEVFIQPGKKNYDSYNHLCVGVDNIDDFIQRCKHQNLVPYIVFKGEKPLFFVRDFVGNLYEIKEN